VCVCVCVFRQLSTTWRGGVQALFSRSPHFFTAQSKLDHHHSTLRDKELVRMTPEQHR
jgi:hypothetical protein